MNIICYLRLWLLEKKLFFETLLNRQTNLAQSAKESVFSVSQLYKLNNKAKAILRGTPKRFSVFINTFHRKCARWKKLPLRPRLHGTGRIWDRSEIRPFSPVHTRIRPVRGSQIRLFPGFSCVYTAERDEFQPGSKFVRYRACKRGLNLN